VAPISSSRQRTVVFLGCLTYNYLTHGEPHSSSATRPVTEHEVGDASSKVPKVVDRHNDAGETVVGIYSGVTEDLYRFERTLFTIHGLEKAFVADDPAENSLIITCALS
jgi:hypothetical protein